jgi:hypothetical protein
MLANDKIAEASLAPCEELKSRARPPAWRNMVLIAIAATSLVLAADICVLIWCAKTFPIRDGLSTVFTGMILHTALLAVSR